MDTNADPNNDAPRSTRRTRAGVVPCSWCRRPIRDAATTGRPRRYCRRSCRQRAFEARRRAAEVGLTESQLIVTRAERDALHDALYVLEAAVEDIERDLETSNTEHDVRAALDWLRSAALPLIAMRADP